MDANILWLSAGVIFSGLVIAARIAAGERKSDAPPVSEEQMRCHGAWAGKLRDQDIYLSIHEVGQFIEGTLFVNETELQFSGSYIAPKMLFDVLTIDGNTLSFDGYVECDGAMVTGFCQNSDTRQAWSASLVSDPAETRRLDLDVMNKLTRTYIKPGYPETRAKILGNPEGLSPEDKVWTAAHQSARVWQVPIEQQQTPKLTSLKPEDASAELKLYPVAPQPVSAHPSAPTGSDATGAVPTRVSGAAVAPTNSVADGAVTPDSAAAPGAVQESKLPPDPAGTSADGPVIQTETASAAPILCSTCNAVLNQSFNFCLHCGHSR